MPKLIHQTQISASVEVCFDLARNAAFHVESARETGERIVEGKTSGHFELGDVVVFEGRHLGIKQRLGARITEMEKPLYFVDQMTRGAFRSLTHRHEFSSESDGRTIMTDTLEWRSPFGPIGRLADILVIERHLRKFIALRGQRIKIRAETQTPVQ